MWWSERWSTRSRRRFRRSPAWMAAGPRRRRATGWRSSLVLFDFDKDIQQASQDIRDAISTKREDLPTEMKEPVSEPARSERDAGDFADAHIDDGSAGDADAARRSRHRARPAVGPRRGRSECGGRDQARDDGASASVGPAGERREHRRRRAGDRPAEPRGPGGAAERRARGAIDPPQGPAGRCRRILPTSSWPSAAGRSFG